MSVQDELLQIIEKQSQFIQQCHVSLKQVNSAIASQQQTIQQQQRRITQLEQQLETVLMQQLQLSQMQQEANSNLNETSSMLIKTQQLCADMLNQAKK